MVMVKADTTSASTPVSPAQAGTVFSDNFADGDRDDGEDATDTNWWYTTNSSSLEIATDKLGLVSGGSGRGLRTTFSPQALAEGQTLQGVYQNSVAFVWFKF